MINLSYADLFRTNSESIQTDTLQSYAGLFPTIRTEVTLQSFEHRRLSCTAEHSDFDHLIEGVKPLVRAVLAPVLASIWPAEFRLDASVRVPGTAR